MDSSTEHVMKLSRRLEDVEFLNRVSSPQLTTTQATMISQGYVEWYWVALGLIVPVLLGSIFCILDHFRRKKMTVAKHTEQRLESMCERNKYVPPSYDEVIPNDIVIISVSDLAQQPETQSYQYTTAQIPASPSCSTISTLSSISTVSVEYNRLNSNSTTSGLSADTQVTNLDNNSVSELPTVNEQEAGNEDAMVEVDLADAPPSYEEYDQYEIYCQRMEIV